VLNPVELADGLPLVVPPLVPAAGVLDAADVPFELVQPATEAARTTVATSGAQRRAASRAVPGKIIAESSRGAGLFCASKFYAHLTGNGPTPRKTESQNK
jgi:hypothetical protein